MSIIVHTAEVNGGNFEFSLPDDGCRDFTLLYGKGSSVCYSQNWNGRSDFGLFFEETGRTTTPAGENLPLKQIYPVLKNKSHRFKARGGGGTLVGKVSEFKSVSITTPASSDRRLDLKRNSDFTLSDDDDDDDYDYYYYDDDDCFICGKSHPSSVSITNPTSSDQSITSVRHAVISHYLGLYSKSSSITPCVVHTGGNPVAYSAGPVNNTTTTKNYMRPPFLGVPLLEVVSVVIKNNNKNNQQGCVSLYGTISVDDGLTPEYIYEKKRDNSESISFPPDGDNTTASLLLTGPSRPFCVYDSLFIDLALMDKKNHTDEDDDDAILYKGKMYWNSYLGFVDVIDDGEKRTYTSEVLYIPPDTAYDKPLATIFNGRSGVSVTINYFMLMHAVGANVEVTLLNHRRAPHVYGLIQAGSKCGSSTTYWSVLLQKKNDEHIDYVRPGQLIPLSRSFVAVDGRSSLKVSLELYDRLHDTDLSQDDEIVKGTVVLPAQKSGTSEKIISGCNGAILVKATWSY